MGHGGRILPRSGASRWVQKALPYLTQQEMKDRYYTICRRLVRTRTASDPAVQQQQIAQYSFDKGGLGGLLTLTLSS